MTSEEIQEYNKLCAEFLGWKSLSPKTKYCYWKFPEELCFKLRCSEPVHSNNLLFHTDWNWIIEVEESIEKLDDMVYLRNERLGGINFYTIDFNNEATFYGQNLSKKEAVIEAIYQFLKWYKTQNI